MSADKSNAEDKPKVICNNETCYSRRRKSILKNYKPLGPCGGGVCPKDVVEDEKFMNEVQNCDDDTCPVWEDAPENLDAAEDAGNRCTDATCPFPVNYKPKLYSPDLNFAKNFGTAEFDEVYGSPKCTGPCKPSCPLKSKEDTKIGSYLAKIEPSSVKFSGSKPASLDAPKGGPCGIPSCSYGKKSQSKLICPKTKTYDDFGDFTTAIPKCPYLDDYNTKFGAKLTGTAGPCGIKTCPFPVDSKKPEKSYMDDLGVYGSKTYEMKTNKVCNRPTFSFNLPKSENYEDTFGPCGIPSCPYKIEPKPYKPPDFYDDGAFCKIPTCPMNTQKPCLDDFFKMNEPKKDYGFSVQLDGTKPSVNKYVDNGCNISTCPYGTNYNSVYTSKNNAPFGTVANDFCKSNQYKPDYDFNAKKLTNFSLNLDRKPTKCPYLPDKADICSGYVCQNRFKPTQESLLPNRPSGMNWSTAATCGGDTCFGDKPKPPDTCTECPLLHKPKKMFAPCGSAICPEAEEVEDEEDLDICGSPECRYTKQAAGEHYEVCGNSSCPYLKEKRITREMFGEEPVDDFGVCENPTCPYATKRDEVIPCGIPECRYGKSSYTTEMDKPKTSEIKMPLPQNSQIKRSLNSNRSSLKTYTNEIPYSTVTQLSLLYGNYSEYGLLSQENRGYDDLCDCKNYNPYPQPRIPCPYTDNPYMGMYVGYNRVPCPYLSDEAEGICGVPKEYCCGSPDVEPCNSPDCGYKVTDECNVDTCPYLRNVSFSEEAEDSPEDEEDGAEDDEDIEAVRESLDPAGDRFKSNQTVLGEEKDEPEESTVPAILEEPTFPKKKKVVKKREKYDVYYTYPGVQLGHKHCSDRGRNIPANMGWLWNARPPGNAELWRGYKPGAVSRTVHKMIRNHRRALGIYDPLDTIKKKRSKASTKTKSEEKLKHAIEIKKTEGDYYISISPMKDPNAEECSQNPFVECTPFQFKVTKNPKEEKSVALPCGCESKEEVEQSTSESDLEFSFSPPAGLPDPRPKKKKLYQTIHTQCDFPSTKTASKKGKKGKKDKKGKKGGKGKKKKK